jgi:ElaB/YqjD/DUF883 family membrane-anchored ribosome-binding protein
MSMHTPLSDTATQLGDRAADKAEQIRQSTQRAADRFSESVHEEAVPALQRLAAQAEALARRSLDAARNGSHQLREQADRVSHNTVNYIRDEPVKAVLIAAAAGAAIVALASLLSRSNDRR